MAEITNYSFAYKEIVEALIRKQNLHEGIWQLTIEFGLGAANITTGENQLSPAAIIPIKKIGIRRVDTENPLAADAAIVNPII